MFIDGILHFHSLYLNTCHYREQDLLLLDALSPSKPLLSMFIDGICFIHCTSILAIMRGQDLLLLDALSINLLSMFIDGIYQQAIIIYVHLVSVLFTVPQYLPL